MGQNIKVLLQQPVTVCCGITSNRPMMPFSVYKSYVDEMQTASHTWLTLQSCCAPQTRRPNTLTNNGPSKRSSKRDRTTLAVFLLKHYNSPQVAAEDNLCRSPRSSTGCWFLMIAHLHTGLEAFQRQRHNRFSPTIQDRIGKRFK